jgi:glycosyltransferase involved in cell wall biosynthesis
VGICQEIALSNQTHFLARTEEDWYTHLSRLLTDESLRRRMGESGRQHAVEHFSIQTHVQTLAKALHSAV